APGRPGEQLVGGQLHVLVGVGVRGELAGRVRVEPRERDHGPAADAARDVLERRGVRSAGLELLAHEALLLTGLVEVLEARRRRPPAISAAVPAPAADTAETLRQLTRLHESGVLTDAELERIRARLNV